LPAATAKWVVISRKRRVEVYRCRLWYDILKVICHK
jgi:hypothetical protein